METVQKVLEWGYVFACLALIWYGISLVSALWRWIRRQWTTQQFLNVLAKFLAAWAFAWGIVWVGIITTAQ